MTRLLHQRARGSAFVMRGQWQGTLGPAVHRPMTLEDIGINAAAYTRQDIAEDVPLVSTRVPRRPSRADHPAARPWRTRQFSFSIRRPKRRHLDAGTAGRSGRVRQGASRTAAVSARVRARRSCDGSTRREKWKRVPGRSDAGTRCSTSCSPARWTAARRTSCGPTPMPSRRTWRIGDASRTRRNSSTCRLPDVVQHVLFQGRAVGRAQRQRPACWWKRPFAWAWTALSYQELRDEAALGFLNVLKSGHWGMTTTHTDSAGEVHTSAWPVLVKENESGTTPRTTTTSR